MTTQFKPSFFTLLLLISFASVNAVLYTPALPSIAKAFDISHDMAQLTMSWFLIGYAIGQLIYGPMANRFGRKPALYAGIILQMISSLICVSAGIFHNFFILILGRFMLALGSGVGLKMTFTLVNECYAPKIASQKISYLMLAFAVTPGLGVALGGILNTHFGWNSCFYASAVYGLILFILSMRLPETQTTLDLEALQITHLWTGYSKQFKNKLLLAGGFLMASCSSFIYVFAAVAPFIAITILGMNSAEYGFANLLPPLGLISGSLLSARLTQKFALGSIVLTGILTSCVGVLVMIIAITLHAGAIFSLFLPMIIIYFGLSLILANASVTALSQVSDKSHGSAVMNFVNMGTTTLVVLSLKFMPLHIGLLPIIYLILCSCMLLLYRWMMRQLIIL